MSRSERSSFAFIHTYVRVPTPIHTGYNSRCPRTLLPRSSTKQWSECVHYGLSLLHVKDVYHIADPNFAILAKLNNQISILALSDGYLAVSKNALDCAKRLQVVSILLRFLESTLQILYAHIEFEHVVLEIAPPKRLCKLSKAIVPFA